MPYRSRIAVTYNTHCIRRTTCNEHVRCAARARTSCLSSCTSTSSGRSRPLPVWPPHAPFPAPLRASTPCASPPIGTSAAHSPCLPPGPTRTRPAWVGWSAPHARAGSVAATNRSGATRRRRQAVCASDARPRELRGHQELGGVSHHGDHAGNDAQHPRVPLSPEPTSK